MKTQTLLKSIFGLAFIALLLPMASCDSANNPSALVGRWVGVSGSDNGVVMDLLSDGTGIFIKGSNGHAITWKTENGRFYIIASGRATSMSHKLQGSVLTFTEDNGKITEYAKCKKDCEEAVKEYDKAKAAEARTEAKANAKKIAPTLKAKAQKGSFTDSRDNKTYKTVILDNQTWMAENLNYNADGSKCYENQESNCEKYGRLYNWSTAKSACPSGWNLPSDAEWQTLEDFAGGYKIAGEILKASGGWNEDGNGIDVVGFSALPGGGSSSGDFYTVGKRGNWWSSTENYTSKAYFRSMYSDGASVFKYNNDKTFLFSVRCVQDN